MKNKNIIFLIIIIGITSFFRLWQLNDTPPGLYPDVAMNGTNALHAITNNNYRVFYQENNGREGLFMNLIAISFQWFGVHLWSLRLIGSLIGIFTVLGIYFLTKELLKNYFSSAEYQEREIRQTAKAYIPLLASFFTAVSFWHVNFSRVGFRAILVPFVTVWSFYFLLKWWDNTISQKYNSKFKNLHSILLMILAGVFFGLGFHTYIAFRFVPFIVLVLAFSQFIYIIKNKYYKKITRWLAGYIIFSVAAMLVMLPLLLYFYQNPEDFMGRAAQVSIFEQPKPLAALGESLLKTAGMFTIYGDPNWRHNYSGSPLLYWPIGIFFTIGIFLSLRQLFSPKHKIINTKNNILLISWFILILAPSYLTAEGLPHALRSIGAIPPVMVWAAIGAWWLYQEILYLEFLISKKIRTVRVEIQNLKLTLKTICCIVLVLITFHEFKKYFYDWGENPEVRGAFTQNLVDVGNFIKNLDPDTRVYIVVNEGGVLVEDVPVSAQTVKFIYATDDGPKKKPDIHYIVPEKISEITTSQDTPTIIVAEHYDEKIFNELQAKFKNGIIKNKGEISYFIINK